MLLPATGQALAPVGQTEVQKLVNEGKHAQALKLIEEQIAKAPKDPQLQFQRGVVLSMLNRKPEALEAFKKLVAENPNMAPAYNNMAVIYGAMSDYDSAKAALDKAVKISPDYATAYQNLGDVYAQLAMQSYQKSLQLDKSDPTVPPKVTALRDMLNAGGEKVVANAKPAPAPAPAPVAVAVAPTPAAPPAAKGGDSAGNSSAEVSAAVRSWASAWSSRDTAAYVAAYAPEFSGSSKSHQAWERERAERITQRSRIKVEVSDLLVSALGDKAEVKFRQSYESDGPTETSRKTLNLVRSPSGQWLITKETSGK